MSIKGKSDYMMNWESVVVEKPWGKEFLIYDNGVVSVWCLEIKALCQTSMHAHPNKLTGIIMVGGWAEFSFLNGVPQRFDPLDKRVIHPHVFHQTHAVDDTIVLESETPPDKLDLTRLEDSYGREGTPYEGADKMRPREREPMIRVGDSPGWNVGDCLVACHRLDPSGLPKSAVNRVHVFLRGGLIGKKGQPVCLPGHIVWSADIMRLLPIADIIEGTEVMTVW